MDTYTADVNRTLEISGNGTLDITVSTQPVRNTDAVQRGKDFSSEVETILEKTTLGLLNYMATLDPNKEYSNFVRS